MCYCHDIKIRSSRSLASYDGNPSSLHSTSRTNNEEDEAGIELKSKSGPVNGAKLLNLCVLYQ